jgi:hypothetical protein
VDNPATGGHLATVPNLKGRETEAAIGEAASAFGAWANRTGKERAEVLRRCAGLSGLGARLGPLGRQWKGRGFWEVQGCLAFVVLL